MIEHRDRQSYNNCPNWYGKNRGRTFWIGNNKGFFTLPLKTAINAMYNRITEKIILENYQDKDLAYYILIQRGSIKIR